MKEYDPEQIIVFGSHARGEADEYSDLDIVIIKETEKRFLDRLKTVYELVQPTFAMDVLVYTPKELAEMQRRGNPFIEMVLKEGGSSMKNPRTEGERWLKQAEYELRAAEHNLEGAFHSIACFHAQQAAEKALKAFLYAQGERVVIGHSVATLCQRCGHYEKRFADLAKRTGKLDRFYMPTRYPNAWPGGVPAEFYDEGDAVEAIALASEHLCFGDVD